MSSPIDSFSDSNSGSDSESESDSNSNQQVNQNNKNMINVQQKGKKQVYDNCKIYDKNNNLVGVCSKKRFNWYIKKGIVDILSHDEIRFKFDINCKYDKLYTVEPRKNICYCCSSDNNLVKFRAVPSEYKKHFPKEWKHYNSYDILSLCKECSDEATAYINDRKIELEEKYNISKNDFIDRNIIKCKVIAKSIVANKKLGLNKEDSINQLNKLMNKELSFDEIQELASANENKLYDGCASTAEYIVKQVIKEEGDEGVHKIIDEWKHYFVDMMDPDDLPKDYFNVNRIPIQLNETDKSLFD